MTDLERKGSADLISEGDDLPPRRFLTPRQVAMIDEALCSLGEFGELRLVVEKSRLRFLVTNKSYDALKWAPGMMRDDGR